MTTIAVPVDPLKTGEHILKISTRSKGGVFAKCSCERWHFRPYAKSRDEAREAHRGHLDAITEGRR